MGAAGRGVGGGAVMAPQARRGDDGEMVPWRAACALEWGGDGKAQQGSSRAAAGQRARAVQRRSERGARVLCRTQGGVKGERERVEKSTV